MEKELRSIICLCGNDGTGKSTLVKLISQLHPELHVIERSTPQNNSSLQVLRKEIKRIDQLTYRYAWEKDRSEFEPSHFVEIEGNRLPVHWIMLDLHPSTIQKRIAHREQMGIYQSKKCVEYYSFVYLELAAYYGMTVVSVESSPAQISQHIFELVSSGATKQIRNLSLKEISYSRIREMDVQQQIISSLSEEEVVDLLNSKVLPQLQSDSAFSEFYLPDLFQQLKKDEKVDVLFAKKLAARWIIKENPTIRKDNTIQCIKFTTLNQEKQVTLFSPSFIFSIEGQSKLIYEVRSANLHVQNYFKNKLWILLKSTIYSHTNQHTGQIADLGRIRAAGSNLFLEMLRRNNLRHAYIAVNPEGVILSNRIETNAIEVVFKKEFVGTDKHSYFGMPTIPELVTSPNIYAKGIYVRFDWRNPNHFLPSHPNTVINQNPYYYLIEKHVGKQNFFLKFLKKPNIKPLGDKCISQDLISGYVNTQGLKKAVLQLYCAFAYYCSRVSLEIIDGCCMFDSSGSVAWSEINPDCLRVKKLQTGHPRQDYDKDIWRSGGSSSRQKIVQKWSLFNRLLIDYFSENRFHETELLTTTPMSYPLQEEASKILSTSTIKPSEQYRSILNSIIKSTSKRKEAIATIDISQGKPTLVKSSLLSEVHSDSNLSKAYDFISLLPTVVLVDLDAALGRDSNNRQAIVKLHKKGKNIFGVGGGIRTSQALSFYLSSGVKHLILSSNLQLLDDLPRKTIEQRIIVELSINENNEVLTHGRTINSGINVIKKMIELSRLGVKTISITFHHKEGHLQGIPRDQMRDIMFQVPGLIQKVIIAGGISDISDLEYIWGFPKAVPQLGSAIWKGKIAPSQILNRLISFDEKGLCSAIISDSTGSLLGQIYMNEQSIKLTVETGELHRYSRQHKRLMKKGEQSGNTQKVVGIRMDCDSDCLNIIVEESNKPFCHNGTISCFYLSGLDRNHTINSLQRHIERCRESGSGYSKRMQENPDQALSKIIEECQELALTQKRSVEQTADIMAHLLMYLNGKGIQFSEVEEELALRSQKSTKTNKVDDKKIKTHILGFMGGKHFEKIDVAAENLLGIKVHRSTNRSLKLTYEITDPTKYEAHFGDSKVELLGIKSKDMSLLLDKGVIASCFNYCVMMENYPRKWSERCKEAIQGIRLVLLQRSGQKVDPKSWTPANKGRIASEYPYSLVKYLNSLGIDETCYTIIRVCGGTESFLMTSEFDYCDAIVQTGTTIAQNNLQIVAVLYQPIFGALYYPQ